MSSNLHRNSTEANKHTPKGFDLAVNNSRLVRDERGQSRYIDNLLNERAENLVDGNSAPPTTTEGHVYVLIDEGSGSVHVDWQGAGYNDIVRVQGGVWGIITPTAGYFIYNKTDGKYYLFNGTNWIEFVIPPNWGSIGGTLSDQTDLQTALDLKLDIADAYGGKRYTLIKPNGTKEFYDTLTQVRSNWADGDVLHQFADETNITYVNVSGGVMYDIPSIFWNGNGFKTKVNTVLAISNYAFNIQSSKTVFFFGVNLSSQGVNGIITLRNQSNNLYMDKASFIRIQVEESRGSSSALNTTGTTYGGNVIPEGDALVLTTPPLGLTGSGTCVGVNTSGFQTGSVTNFFSGDTNYPCATNFEHSFCNFGGLAIGNGRTFDHCTILSTRNNNGTANFQTFVARNCTIIHTPSASTHTFYNIPNIILINCTFITTGYLCASFGGTAGFNIIQGGYYAFAGQTYFAKNNYSSLVQISDCTIEATNPGASTDVFDFTNASSTNVKINNVTFKNANGRSDIRVAPANNVEWKNCRFSKGSAHISVSSGTVADAYNNNPARLTDPIGYLNNTGNGNWFMYVPMTTAERDALTSVSAGFQIRNTTTNFLQVYNGSTWKDLLNLT